MDIPGPASRSAEAEPAPEDTYTLTFSEFPRGTAIFDQYKDFGIEFEGTLPVITSDGANPTSPVLSGVPVFGGDIEGRFTNPDELGRTVDSFAFDIGYINNPGAVVVQLFDADGQQLTSVPVNSTGIVPVVVTYPGVASFKITATGYEAAGWAIDNFAFPGFTVHADTYVALGDSFQSGEGAYDYLPGTDIDGVNECHRSANAYPELLVDRGVVNLTLDFRACSGAVIANLYAGTPPDGPQWNESPQIGALNADTKLVTVGVVGNDLGIAPILDSCAYGVLILWGRPCYSDHGDEISAALESLQSGTIHDDLLRLYHRIREEAPFARVIVVFYPRFLPTDEAGYTETHWLGFSTCQLIPWVDGAWINSSEKKADELIGDVAAEAGFDYVNMIDAFDGHDACSTKPAANGIVDGGASESFHPNAYGHTLMADRVEDTVLTAPVYPSYPILPNQTITEPIEVSGGTLYISANWPGSDVEVSLVSPSGVRYDRSDLHGAAHDNGATYEYYTIDNPEHGTWTLELYGADVAPAGESVAVSVVDQQAPTPSPDAAFATSGQGSTRTFDARGSTAPNGALTYQWDFGDGTTGEGAVVTHTFTIPGDHYVALRVSDATGADDFAVIQDPIHVDGDPLGLQYQGFTGSVHLTNDMALRGGVVVDGDLACDSNGQINGTVIVTGSATLTNNCAIAAVNGLHVTSADGQPHNLTIVATGDSDGTGGTVNLGASTVVDPEISATVFATGTLTAGTGTRLPAYVQAGSLSGWGTASIGYLNP